MNPALLLVDVQMDFLNRPGLVPNADTLVPLLKRLLLGCRALKIPVLHVHTQILRDGSNRMPHWHRHGIWECVRGTDGVLPPASLQPADNESVYCKQFYSAFSNSTLQSALRDLDVNTVLIAGLYLHSCVRATVLDAYQRGYEVWVVEDAVGSTEPEHSEITRCYLDNRAATFLDTRAVLARLGKSQTASQNQIVPMGNINGTWLAGDPKTAVDRRNPSNWSATIGSVPLAQPVDVENATLVAADAALEWIRTPWDLRASRLNAWAVALEEKSSELAGLLALEIGKPVVAGREEIQRAIAMLRATANSDFSEAREMIGNRPFRIHARPHGVVALITPWNNPIAIPVGKIAAAMAYGNSVVWKPAIEAPRSAMMVLNLLLKQMPNPGLVNLIFGNSATARLLIDDPRIAAVSLTGSIESGRSAVVRCSQLGKPLQAEMGGNNAAVVLCDCDIAARARDMALAAFLFCRTTLYLDPTLYRRTSELGTVRQCVCTRRPVACCRRPVGYSDRRRSLSFVGPPRINKITHRQRCFPRCASYLRGQDTTQSEPRMLADAFGVERRQLEDSSGSGRSFWSSGHNRVRAKS